MTSRSILLVHPHFWPDVTTYAQLLRLLGAHLAAEGHRVTVLSAQPSYHDAYRGPRRPAVERLDGMRVLRVPVARGRRLLSAALFLAGLAGHLVTRSPRYDLVITSALPPVVTGLAVRIAARVRGMRYVYNCLDLYPEAAVHAGLLRDGRPARALAALDSGTCRDAAAVVVLSDDMRRTLIDRPSGTGDVRVINNPVVASASGREPERGRTFRVLFAGNLGRFQGLEAVVDAARLLRATQGIEFVFLGAGPLRGALEERAGDLVGRSVTFAEHVPVADALRAMQAADLGVIALRPGIARVAYPSKTMMYLEAGCRVLAAVEPDSELAGFVTREGLGSAVAPGDPHALAAAICAEYDRHRRAGTDRAAIRRVAAAHFSQETVFARWSALVAELTG